MRFLHIADLHIGKQMNDVSLMPDQEYILQQIVSIAESERVDAVLIAGDIYQRSSPQADAMELFDHFVSQLVAQGRKVFIISGNHDSAQRISYFSSLIKSSGVYVTESFEGKLQNITLRDGSGDIVIWMMPFLRPSYVKRWIPEEKIITYQDAIEAVLRQTAVDTKKRNILLCHQFITGSETSDSEEHAVGGLDNINATVFDAFDYVALGHIHKPQKVLRDTLRYAGSPLKYSFSEAGHKKSVTLVDVESKDDIIVRTVPLYPLHDVRLLEGMMNDLLDQPYSEDYVWITIHDELAAPDARVTMSTNFPNMMKFSVVNSKTKMDMDVLGAQSMENKTIADLFSDFYRLQNNDQDLTDAHRKIINKVLKDMEENP